MLFNASLENACSEQGARMSAMDSSTRNATEMLEKLTLKYNRLELQSFFAMEKFLHPSKFDSVCKIPYTSCSLMQISPSLNYNWAYWDYIWCRSSGGLIIGQCLGSYWWKKNITPTSQNNLESFEVTSVGFCSPFVE